MEAKSGRGSEHLSFFKVGFFFFWLACLFILNSPLFPFFFFLIVQFLNHCKADRYQIQAIDNPTMYRLSISGENSSEREEATFIVHGIIMEKDFPPITVSKYVKICFFLKLRFGLYYDFLHHILNIY